MAAAYASYALRVDSSSDTSLTGTSHHAEPGGLGPYRSVSTWTTVVAELALAWAIALVNSSTVDALSTAAPRLAALAARSTGSTLPSSSPVSPLR